MLGYASQILTQPAHVPSPSQDSGAQQKYQNPFSTISNKNTQMPTELLSSTMKKASHQPQGSTSDKKRFLSGRRKLSASEEAITTPADCTLKKTRDLPNLSECQACGFRIHQCTGKNKIQILSSEWRIVLLCKKCLSLVESSRICAYCFEESNDDCFSCRQCKRSIHQTCHVEYRSVPPWSYSCPGEEFTICVDCWLPNSIKKKRGFVPSSKKDGKNCTELGNLKSRVLNSCSSNNAKCSDNRGLRRKVVLGLVAGKISRGKLFAVKKPQEPLNKLRLRKTNDEDNENGNKPVDDVELAIQLHRAINSSPRISRSSGAANFSCHLSVQKAQEPVVDLVKRESDSGNPIVVEVGDDRESDRRSLDSLASNGIANSKNSETGALHGNELKFARVEDETHEKTCQYRLKYSRGTWRSKAVASDKACL